MGEPRHGVQRLGMVPTEQISFGVDTLQSLFYRQGPGIVHHPSTLDREQTGSARAQSHRAD
jgi:hypothetical protein